MWNVLEGQIKKTFLAGMAYKTFALFTKAKL